MLQLERRAVAQRFFISEQIMNHVYDLSLHFFQIQILIWFCHWNLMSSGDDSLMMIHRFHNYNRTEMDYLLDSCFRHTIARMYFHHMTFYRPLYSSLIDFFELHVKWEYDLFRQIFQNKFPLYFEGKIAV